MKNEQLIYENQVMVAYQNLEAIYTKIWESDIRMINQMIQSDDDLIVRINLKDL